ncbi:MAG: phage tail protein I [Rhodospirillales bacterium]|nr:phage tail protein I [Rhodospirillales bacterium]
MSAALLPPNATALERAMADTAAARLLALEADTVGTLWDPMLCPEPWLERLAAAYGTAPYDSGWSEERRRTAVADTAANRSRHGTVAAIRRILAFAGAIYDLTEHRGAQHHTITVTLHNSDSLIRSLLTVHDLVDQVKRLSVHVTFVSKAMADKIDVAAASAAVPVFYARADVRR